MTSRDLIQQRITETNGDTKCKEFSINFNLYN
jgi:hypothetical protein